MCAEECCEEHNRPVRATVRHIVLHVSSKVFEGPCSIFGRLAAAVSFCKLHCKGCLQGVTAERDLAKLVVGPPLHSSTRWTKPMLSSPSTALSCLLACLQGVWCQSLSLSLSLCSLQHTHTRRDNATQEESSLLGDGTGITNRRSCMICICGTNRAVYKTWSCHDAVKAWTDPVKDEQCWEEAGCRDRDIRTSEDCGTPGHQSTERNLAYIEATRKQNAQHQNR